MAPESTTSHTGAMIALVPMDADLDRLALVNGEPRDELHLTLWYLGNAEDFVQADMDHCVSRVREVLTQHSETWNDPSVLAGNAFGAAHWNPTSEDPAWVLNVGDANGDNCLMELRNVIAQSWGNIEWQPPRQHTPWQPHICLAYASEDLSVEMESRLGPVSFDRVRVVFGSEVTDVLLAQPATVAAAWGGDGMPWHKVHNHSECTTGKPWAVVKDATGEVAGCHATEAEANDQLAALYASESSAAEVSEALVSNVLTEDGHMTEDETNFAKKAKKSNCGNGYQQMPDGSCMSDADLAAESRWSGVLCVEGTATGDGREFGVNALTWADHALLRWQKEGSHGGDHDVTVSVGRIDQVWRDGNIVYGSGVLDLQNADGFEVWRRMKDDFAGGISIDADDITDADVEFVWPENSEDSLDDEGDILKFLFGRPEKMIYHAGRVRAATIVDIPAFVEAHIGLVGDVSAVTPGPENATLAVVAAHTTETSDAAWDSKLVSLAQQKRSATLPREAFAWTNDGTTAYLHHHSGNADGDLGPANVTACAASIARLNAGDDTIPIADRQGVYDHLASHLRDAGMEPPLPVFETSLVASASVVEVAEWRPSRTWFENPNLSVHTGITVTDQGRVYGHIAPWGECHIGFGDECITPPFEDNHPYFMTGEVICADGSRIAVGQITVGTGHAPLHYQAVRAAEHYDNTGAAVVDVTVGNDAYGIWCAGAIRPSAAASRVHELRASGRVSGDWRRIGGQLRLVGVLAVNVPGFPIPQLRARIASGVPQALVAAGTHLVLGQVNPVSSEGDLDQLAMRRVMNILARRMKPATANVEGAV